MGLSVRLAWGGPPFVTDDPEPVSPQRWEINYSVSKTWQRESASAALPSMDMNYGATSDLQLHLQPRYMVESTSVGRRVGIADTEVGIKYRFLNIEQDDASTMLGIYPMVQLPTADGRLVQDRVREQAFLPIWVQRNWEKWTTYGGFGYRINTGSGKRNSVFSGVTALYQMTETIQLGGEVFHETPDSIDGRSTAGFNVGGTCHLMPGYNLLFSAGKGIQNAAANRLSIYWALQALY
ncbi:MAG: hypothetical protein KGN39_10265 [Betaproteobacteria bacterium]|nr:hypothetical protein [Betaproteobacteria bacterium]